MLSDITHVWSLKKSNLEKQRVEWRLPRVGVGEMRRYWSKGTTPSYTINKFGDLIYSIVIIANNTVSYT